MKAICLDQPYATFVSHGVKPWETRSWPTPYRGTLVVCATQRPPRWDLLSEQGLTYARELLRYYGYETDPGDEGPARLLPAVLERGQAVAVVEVTDCKTTQEVTLELDPARKTDLTALEFGDFGPKRFAWKLENVRRLTTYPAKPVHVRGRQRIFNLSPGEERAVLAALGVTVDAGMRAR